MNSSTEQNLTLFSQLVSIAHDLYFFTFDNQLNCLKTNAPRPEIIKNMFGLTEDRSNDFFNLLEPGMPVSMTGDIKFMWIAEGEKDSYGKLLYIHIIGPVFTEDISEKALRLSLSNANIPSSDKKAFFDILKNIPFIPLMHFNEYGLMLHYCITGEKISVSDIIFPKTNVTPIKNDHSSGSQNAHGSWAAEQKMIHLISEGNPDFQKKFSREASSVNLGQLNTGDPIRYLKNMIIVSITLCSRAAINGGLDPEIGYTLSDRYIKSIEEVSTFAEVVEINNIMQNDFVQRVHKIKSRGNISPQIRKCCDYIQIHAEEMLPLSNLANICGYTKTHLSRKFRQETGYTIKQYIMKEKILRAQDMLKAENLSVQDVAEKLGLESQSYFGKKFREITGKTPSEFRSVKN